MDPSIPSRATAALLHALNSRDLEIASTELFRALNLDESDYFLRNLEKASAILHGFDIAILPTRYDFAKDSMLVLRKSNKETDHEASLIDRIKLQESANQEFKSTYWCDVVRMRHQTSVQINELRSDAVKHSALKSVAGFLTTGGGTLYIGVDDNGEIIGLCPDLRILSSASRNIDQLVNNIRTDIAQRFRDGNTVNDYVTVTPRSIKSCQVLELAIASRRRLSFLKCGRSDKSDYELYRRQGNRTTRVKVYDVIEFEEWRDEHIFAKRHIPIIH